MIRSKYFRQATRSSLIGLLVGLPIIMNTRLVLADQLLNRSLTVGSSAISASTTHTFSITFPDTTVVGSVAFEYCSRALLTAVCTGPAGLDASQATLQQQTGETGFTIGTETANKIILSRSPTATAGETASYTLANVVNPNSAGSFYARILTYASSNGSGNPLDSGVVISAATAPITLEANVAPFLDFCVGQIIPSDCSSASGDFIEFGDFSSSATRTGTSQLAATTNAPFGIAITVNGTTMASGNNIIPALGSPTGSIVGTSQFGMNLRANTIPAVGSEPTGSGSLVPVGSYNVPNKFTFNSGDVIAVSSDVAEFKKLTVSYIANIASNQAVGVYDTTLTYICTATF